MFLITLPDQVTTTKLLTDSCKQRNIDLVILDPATTNPFKLQSQPGDILYRISDAKHYGCLGMEYQLMSQGITTFYADENVLAVNQEENDFLLPLQGIPVPKTASFLPRDRSKLMEVVEQLGGFPIVLKALGGSHGVGVMRLDSYESLFSVSDYLLAQGGRFVLKEYIDVTSSARLIVLGDNVIDSIKYQANRGDFRSNEGAVPNVSAATFSSEIQQVAIRAVRAMGLEFGGVDILISGDKHYVAEVNFPCFFPRCQMLTGVDISGMMIDYLIAKAKKSLKH